MERGIEYNLDRYVLELNAEVKQLRKQAALLEQSAEMLRYMKWKVRSLQDRLDIATKAKNGVD
jgi:prefoldin subunit 5